MRSENFRKWLCLVLAIPILCAYSGEDLKPFVDSVDKLKLEKQTKEKAAVTKLIAGLKTEEKTAQNAGKLDVLLAIRARLAELEFNAAESPLSTAEKAAPEPAMPIANSASEKNHADALVQIQKDYKFKLQSVLKQLEAKKVALTKAGKIDDALTVDEMIADLTSATPHATSVAAAPAAAKADTPGIFAGVWAREGSGTQFKFGVDGSVEKLTNKGMAGNTDYDEGKWRKEQNFIIVEFQKKIIVQFQIKGDGSLESAASAGSAGTWKLIKKQ